MTVEPSNFPGLINTQQVEGKMKKVLIVENSITISNAIRIILEAGGLAVEQTSDGAKAVEAAKQKGIDLIILDLMMPGVSGFDVFKMLKEDEQAKKIPVIILSAKTDALNWHSELRACDKFMPKPFDNKDLLEAVKKLLNRQ